MHPEDNETNSNLSPTARQVLEDFVRKLAADDDIGGAASERIRELVVGSKPATPDDFARVLFDPPEGESH